MSGYPISRKNSDPGDKKSPGYPEGKKSRILEIAKKPEKINPDPGNSGIFGIFHSGFFRDFQIPIPIPRISGFLGFFDLAQNKNPDPEANSVF